MERKAYEFTLIMQGIEELSDEIADALFEAGCDDALLGMRDGVAFLDFCREAASLSVAVLSAIRDVRRARIPVEVIRVEPDDLVTMSSIARRLHRSRESIRQLAVGARGPGGFPPPFTHVNEKSPLWRWSDIVIWLREKKLPPMTADNTSLPSLEEISELALINAILEIHRYSGGRPACAKRWKELAKELLTPARD